VRPRPSHVLILLILLLATGLRLYRLDVQSFWNDEGNAARAAERTVPLILEAAAGDIHPPGYYLLLHFWRALVGETEFALRALSALCGILTVAVGYTLGRRLVDGAVGLGAASLLAMSPLAVYYSQEARMYALLGLLSALSTLLLVLLARRAPAPPRSVAALLVGYALTVAAGLYTHYAFPFVLLVHNLLFLGWWGTAGRWRPRYLVGWVGLQAAALLLFLPWLPIALRSVTGWPSAGQGYALGPALLDVFRALTVGVTPPAGDARWALGFAAGLLLLGLWPRRGRGRAVGVLATWLLVPIALLFAFDLYKPAYLKFLLAVLVPFHLLLAHGAENLSTILLTVRRLPTPGRGLPLAPSLLSLASLVLLLLALVPSLRNLYFDPAYARDDYRQIAADIRAIEQPGDGILLDAPNQWEVFTYYYREGVPVYPIPRSRPPRAEAVVAELEGIAAAHRRLFVLYWGDAEADPERIVEGWLASHAYPAGSRWYGRVRVATYGLGPLPEEPAGRADARFGERIRLLGYAVGEGPFTPGDVVPVTLFWQADGSLSERYKVFLHLMDAQGRLVAQADAEPVGDLLPTTAWPPDGRVIDRHGVLLPDDIPAGEYTLIVGLYHLIDGWRLPVWVAGDPAGDAFPLTAISVVP